MAVLFGNVTCCVGVHVGVGHLLALQQRLSAPGLRLQPSYEHWDRVPAMRRTARKKSTDQQKHYAPASKEKFLMASIYLATRL